MALTGVNVQNTVKYHIARKHSVAR